MTKCVFKKTVQFSYKPVRRNYCSHRDLVRHL